jgi:hypothetical protein
MWQSDNSFLDFKLSPCSECCMLSSGKFSGVWILYADVSEYSANMYDSSYLPAYGDGTECSETSAYKFQTPGNYPEESGNSFPHDLDYLYCRVLKIKIILFAAPCVSGLIIFCLPYLVYQGSLYFVCRTLCIRAHYILFAYLVYQGSLYFVCRTLCIRAHYILFAVPCVSGLIIFCLP